MDDEIRINRSGLRMWLVALAGVPMVVVGIDVLLRRRIFGIVGSLVFTGDPPLIEPRDVIWAVVLLILGLIFIGFGLRELLIPRPAVSADAIGLHLHLGHPLSRLVTIPWSEVDDIGAEDLDDDGSVIPVMWVRVSNPGQLPANPWGARWIEPDTLAVMAADWERTPRSWPRPRLKSPSTLLDFPTRRLLNLRPSAWPGKHCLDRPRRDRERPIPG